MATPRIECLLEVAEEQEQHLHQEESSGLIKGKENQSSLCAAHASAVGSGTGETSEICKEHFTSSFMEWMYATKDLQNRERHSLVDYCRFDLLKVSECLCEIEKENSFCHLADQSLQFELNQTSQQIQDLFCNVRKFSGILEGFSNLMPQSRVVGDSCCRLQTGNQTKANIDTRA